MPRCVSCSSFDPYYKDGWCSYHGRATSPGGECSMSDWGGSHEEYDANKVCATCTSYSSGWCDYHRCETNSSSYCSDYT